MTDLDSPRRNNDCYFYYYSKCNKGDNCTFRHEPSALGCETMCSFWKEGKCLNIHCNYRHMELRKNRKAIQCYWETQPGGCLKQHCPFLHQHERQSSTTTDDNSNTNANNSNSTEETESAEETSQISPTQNGIEGKSSEKDANTQVDSLVVNFEEESDTESIPMKSPSKVPVRKLRVKTLEEIKLERIQEESAAYFAYSLDHPDNSTGEDLRRNLIRKRRRLVNDDSQSSAKKQRLESHPYAGKKMYVNPSIFTKINNNEQEKIFGENGNVTSNHTTNSDQLLGIINKGLRKNTQTVNLETIKIKTLEEIRAEKKRKLEMDSNVALAEISSTTKDEDDNKKEENEKPVQRKKIKLRRWSSAHKELVNTNSDEEKQTEIKELKETQDEKETVSTKNIKENMEIKCVEPADSALSPQYVDTQYSNKANESETMLLEDALDYEDDGLMNEIDSILST